MSEQVPVDRVAVPRPRAKKPLLIRPRWAVGGLAFGLVAGAWIGGGPDRYGEPEGVAGGLRGAGRTLSRGFDYLSATIQDCVASEPSSVRRIGLGQQIQTRLWQDKRLAAEGIIVEVEADGTAVLKGIVPDDDHKDQAVVLARETRGVEKVVDELAVRPSARTIDAVSAAAVPTGVVTDSSVIR
ncbi:BON domain-containing protein [Tundrisphaera sp. TA3]|uniref:BON domain-containing protein n=1 Tax=Tundrisphaera sp. TA3 TaxID=3435775 RepID=UPI003EBC8AF4